VFYIKGQNGLTLISTFLHQRLQFSLAFDGYGIHVQSAVYAMRLSVCASDRYTHVSKQLNSSLTLECGQRLVFSHLTWKKYL